MQKLMTVKEDDDGCDTVRVCESSHIPLAAMAYLAANTSTSLAVGLLHVHVSGSAGTTMCALARQQPAPSNSSVAARSFACLMPCKGPAYWRTYAGLHAPESKEFANCMVKYASDRLKSCSGLRHRMATAGYGVIGAIETLLDEANNSAAFRSSFFAFRKSFRGLSRASGCGRTQPGCCICNAPSVFDASGGVRNESFVVDAGGPSPFDSWWPLAGFRPFANLRYTIFVHEPLHRLVNQLLMRCPDANVTARTCGPWAVEVLAFCFRKDLVLDIDRGGLGLAGTPAISNYVHRMLLGPRVFFARLRALRRAHHHAALAMLRRFSLVLPVRNLSHLPRLLEKRFGWAPMRMVARNQHGRGQLAAEDVDVAVAP